MPPALAQLLAQPIAVLLIGTVAITSVVGWIIPPLRRAFELRPYEVARGQVHRLLTNGFLHAGPWHLGVNMLALYFFAGNVTEVIGEALFAGLYLSALVVASIPTAVRHRKHRGYRSLGASGAVAAVMFTAILLHPKRQIALFFLPLPIPAVVLAAAYLAYSAVQALADDSDVNHDAHFFGALYGVLFTYAVAPARVERAIQTLKAYF